MPKYAGLVGYVTTKETSLGVWEQVASEHKMRGDVIRVQNSSTEGSKINDDISMNNRISLVGNQFAYQNFMNIKYIMYMGIKWKVSSVEVQRPRLILTLGGVWNDQD